MAQYYKKMQVSYPLFFAVLLPFDICQWLSKALYLPAANVFVTRIHFTFQPAGGRQVPPQHWVAVHLALAHRHWYISPDVAFEEIWNGHTENISILIVNCPPLWSQTREKVMTSGKKISPVLMKGQVWERFDLWPSSFHTWKHTRHSYMFYRDTALLLLIANSNHDV